MNTNRYKNDDDIQFLMTLYSNLDYKQDEFLKGRALKSNSKGKVKC